MQHRAERAHVVGRSRVPREREPAHERGAVLADHDAGGVERAVRERAPPPASIAWARARAAAASSATRAATSGGSRPAASRSARSAAPGRCCSTTASAPSIVSVPRTAAAPGVVQPHRRLHRPQERGEAGGVVRDRGGGRRAPRPAGRPPARRRARGGTRRAAGAGRRWRSVPVRPRRRWYTRSAAGPPLHPLTRRRPSARSRREPPGVPPREDRAARAGPAAR